MTKAEATREEWRAIIAKTGSRKSASGVSTLETIRSMSGLDFLRAIADGRLPHAPISDTLGFHLVEATKGHAVFIGEPKHDFYNPIGSVHGGWAATLLDSCMACAVHTAVPAGQGYTTVEFKLNCVRPVMPNSGPLRAEGKVINAGRTIATSEGRLVDAGGKLYAHGTETCLIFPL
jgi:uncharacterized protein (TIGR00369 family)